MGGRGAPSPLRRAAEGAALILAALILAVMVLVVYFAVRFRGYIRGYLMRAIPPSRPLSTIAVKSGDLVLMAGLTHMFINSVFYHGLYTHGGVVVMLGGVPYVAECNSNVAAEPFRRCLPPAARSPERGEGTAVYPLWDMLRDYQGVVFLSQLSRPLAPAAEARLVRKATTEKRAFSQFFGWGSIVTRVLLGRQNEARHCFEWVADLLDAAGLAPLGGKRLPEYWSYNQPEAIIELAERGVPLTGGYQFLPPVRLDRA